jgi:hypothetical protein
MKISAIEPLEARIAPATLSINSISPTEGDSGSAEAIFTVSLDAPSTNTVTVLYSTANGTATTVDADYVAKTGQTLTFLPGVTSQEIRIAVNGDLRNEADETFFVNLSNATNADLGTAQGMATILNNDPLPTFSVTSPTLGEGTGANPTVTFTVQLSAVSGQQVTVNYATANGTATTADGDYTALSGTLVFAPGETVKTVQVALTADARDEDNENFFLTLTDPVNAALPGGGPLQGTGTINDDDAAPSISIGDVTIAEGNAGPTSANFMVSLSAPSSRTVTVSYATADDTAKTADNDYVEQTLTTLTFLPGETTKQIGVTINGDGTPEANETFRVNLTNPQNATLLDGSATGTITNDDAKLTIGNATITEGDSGSQNLVFTVTLIGGPLAGGVEVDFATHPGTATFAGAAADFTAVSGKLMFAAGETTKTISVPILGDVISEGDETFTVALSNPVGASILPTEAQATGTITDNEIAPTLAITGTTVTEGNSGTVEAVFTVTLTGTATQSPVTVNYRTFDGTGQSPATSADGDFVSVPITTLTFAPGETTKTIVVLVKGDTKGELDETFRVSLSGAQNATVLDGSASANATIKNDDPALSIAAVSIVEGDNGVKEAIFTVTLTAGPASGGVTVNYATLPGTAVSTGADKDFEAVSGSLTFAAGETAKRIAVPIYGDLRAEANETFLMQLSSPVGATLLQTQAVAGTITDDEPALSIGNVTLVEGNDGTTNAVFTVTLGAPRTGVVTVQYDALNGTATGGSDFTPSTNALLSFAPGETTKTIAIPILGDGAHEADETFFVKLHDAVNAQLGTVQGTGTITNDDGLPTLTVGDVSIVEGNSGLKTAIFTVTLAGATNQEVRVTAATNAGTAAAGVDFLANSQVLVFAPGETTKTFEVQIIGETLGELDETLAVNLSDVQNATIADGAATGTITNDDAVLSVGDVRIVEGNDGTSVARFKVTLAHGGTETVTVQYLTSDGTATTSGAAKDYDAVSGTLTFLPGETEKEVEVTIYGDTNAEADETLRLTLATPANAVIGRAQGTGTITNDETHFDVGNVTIVEGDSGTKSAVFTVARGGSTVGTATIAYATQDGTAISVGDLRDFDAVSGTITFADGEAFKTIVVPIVGDVNREVTEQFSLTLSGATGGLLTGANVEGKVTVTGTITDNDPVPAVSIGDVSIVEGDGGTKLATFTVTLSAKSHEAISVGYATADGTTTAGDYESATGTVNFAPGETSKTISITINGDTADEAEESFFVNLLNPTNATIADAQGGGKILNDDLTLSIANAEVSEGNDGTKNLVFTVSLSAASTHDVTFTYGTQDGTATVAGNDYTAASGTITILAGQTTATINVPIKADALDEGNETLLVNLSGVTGAQLGTATATGTILNDDPATLSINDVTITEGDSGTSNATFTVTLSNASTKPVTVTYGTADGTATLLDGDYTLAGGTLTFAPGETTKTITVPVLGDKNGEPSETFQVLLRDAFNATIADGEGVGTITDTRTVSIAGLTQAEGNNGQTIFSFTVSLDFEAEQQVTVNYATSDGTATGSGAAADYMAANGTVTFAPGEKTKTIEILVNGDTAVEVDETFNVTLSAPVGAAIASGGGVAVGKIANDETTLSFNGTSNVVTEGNTGTTNVTIKLFRSGDTSLPVSVQYATAPGTALSSGARPDFTATSGTVTFAAGETMKEILVPIIGDLNKEAAETFTLKLSNATNSVIVDGDTASVTISDNDTAPTISIGDVTIAEGQSGTKTATFTVSLSGADETGEVSVGYATQDGTAGSTGPNADFAAAAGTLVFAAGEISKTVTITINGDAIVESDETFSVQLADAVNATLGDASATGTITNDDGAVRIGFDGANNGDVTITEGNDGTKTLTFTVKLSAASQEEVTVQFATEDGTAVSSGTNADFAAAMGTLTFAPGETSKEVTVTINGEVVHEGNETLTLRLSAPSGAVLGDATALGTITNDDAQPVLTIANGSIIEGNDGTSVLALTVTLAGSTQETVTVNFATADDTAVSSGVLQDYVARIGTLTFLPGETTKTIEILVNGDTFLETDETFTVTLSGAANAAIGTATGTGTILNGSDTKLGLVLLDAQTTEGTSSSNKNLTFTAQLSAAATSDVTFTLTTLNGTALSGIDFLADPATKTIAAGATSVTFDVLIGSDSEWEATESFFVNLTNASANVEVVDADPIGSAQATARGYIFNDDVNILNGGKKIQWIDVDGDLVTLTVNKGSLVLNANSLDTNLENDDDISLVAEGSVGGRELQRLIFANDGTMFQGVTLSIIATKQPGFPLESDGRVDVGWIAGTSFLGDVVQVTGVDFASLTVDGDVAKITAGDTFSTPAIGKLDVYSLGARGTTTGAPDTESRVIGPITSVNVKQNIEGFLNVIGSEFGNIGTLKIGGALKGGADDASGVLQVSGKINTATIGSIIGGGGENSGLLLAEVNTSRGVGTLKILGDIVGGNGANSGRVQANVIGNVSVESILGGAGANAGSLASNSTLGKVTLGGDLVGGSGATSGVISAAGNAGAIKIAGGILGGSGTDSGSIRPAGNLASLNIGGAVIGGSGTSSGSVQLGGKLGATTIGENEAGDSLVGGAGQRSGVIDGSGDAVSFALAGNVRGGNGSISGVIAVRGTVPKLNIGGSLIGGTPPELTPGVAAPAFSESGYIQAGKLTNTVIAGDIVAGQKGAGEGQYNGAVSAHQIDSLTVNGSLIGNASNPVVITSLGGATGKAIKNLSIKGNVTFATILAGYDVGLLPTGQEANKNADASIGNVTINGAVKGLNLVAGGSSGADGRFGTADDRLLSGTGVTDVAKTIATIASVVIKGNILDNDAPFGVLAQHIVSFKIGAAGTTPVALLKGAGNDVATSDTDPDPGILIASNFRAIELPLPA